ncbi:MAG: phage tail protein [Sphingomonadaceae bacterium]
MATLVFGALGTLVGGPVGGALGTLLGRAVDQQIVGSPSREGPRLTELAVSGSSYGQPIARHFGKMRAGGTIIWSTDLRESRDTSGGGKGQPSTTSYSYSVSLAVALSSRPIASVGRIWADGNLLRGAAGDLKTGGQLRIYPGHNDQQPDPLMATSLGSQCPAHRGLAYIVFEDLQLGDFGNRIPALSFEIFSQDRDGLLADLLEPVPGCTVVGSVRDGDILGFAHDGGTISDNLQLLARAIPLAIDSARAPLTLISPQDAQCGTLPIPADAIAWPDGEFGPMSGSRSERSKAVRPIDALRYYDKDRDYQPGLQRRAGRAATGDSATIELPAALTASEAGAIVTRMVQRERFEGEKLRYRLAEIDPLHDPGAVVRVPGYAGVWRVDAWEWREGGVELELLRHSDFEAVAAQRDPGSAFQPLDRLAVPTLLRCFELPFDGTGSPDAVPVYAAASATDGRWSGAALYVDREGALERLPYSAVNRATTGTLVDPLSPSPALIFEPVASLLVDLDADAMGFASASPDALTRGANRLLVGEEIVQFAHAEPVAAGQWRLTGLIRGRGGTELEAQTGCPAGSRVVLLDDALIVVDGAQFDPATARIAAIGAGDDDPVFTYIERAGRSRRPLTPVHPRAALAPGGAMDLGWTRRARGSWNWLEGVDIPLIEESELYEVGVGDEMAPLATWFCSNSEFRISADQRASLAAQDADAGIWVRQIGSYAKSASLLLATIG